MTDEGEDEGIDYGQFLRPAWLDGSVGPIWIAAYGMLLVTEDEICKATSSIEALGARISLGFGSLEYFDTSNVKMQVHPSRPPTFLNEPEDAETEPGAYVVVAFPMPGGAFDPDQEAAQTIEHAIVGLLVALLGRNAAYRKWFDMTLDVKDDSFGLLGVVDNPFKHGRPNLKDDALLEVEAASKTLDGLTDSMRKRVELSLRWYGESLDDDVDEDAFIKLWVALEVLGMPNQTDVRPLNETLADAYKLSYEEVREQLRVGQIQGLRADMLHEGKTEHHFPLINTYTQALYIDLLRHVLGLPHVGAAQQLLEEAGGIWKRLQELRQNDKS